MIHRFIMSLFFVMLALQSCYSFDFIDTNFEGFMNRVVAPEYHKEFKDYYTHFMKKVDLLPCTKKNNELSRLRNLAFYSLENKHPEWAVQLKPYALYEKDETVAGNEQLKLIRIFLTRYAVCEEFLKFMAQKRAGMWHRFQSYTRHVGSKVATFFNGFRQKEHKRA